MEFTGKSKVSFTEKYSDISDIDPNLITIDWYNSKNGVSYNEPEICI